MLSPVRQLLPEHGYLNQQWKAPDRISLNRPEKLNAIDDEDPVLLQDAVLEAEKDTSVHVIILSGNG